METVIRAPHDCIVRKLYWAGDLYKAGTALVEFAEEKKNTMNKSCLDLRGIELLIKRIALAAMLHFYEFSGAMIIV